MEESSQGSRGSVDGFETATISNSLVQLTVIPALGAKVSSLIHMQNGREWMWRPEAFAHYFPSDLQSPFEKSTLVGWDECLPTIAPCTWKERSLPDHGEVWMSGCEIDDHLLEHGMIRTRLELPLSPFRFTRTLSLSGSKVIARYSLRNLSDQPEEYIWAMHPLFAIHRGDRIEMQGLVRTQLPSDNWVENLVFPEGKRSAKLFADTPAGAEIVIRNLNSGHGLSIRWSDACNPVLGYWLTRGGWHGHHHLALEPTNAKDDGLDEAVARGCHGTLAAHSRREWQVEISLF